MRNKIKQLNTFLESISQYDKKLVSSIKNAVGVIFESDGRSLLTAGNAVLHLGNREYETPDRGSRTYGMIYGNIEDYDEAVETIRYLIKHDATIEEILTEHGLIRDGEFQVSPEDFTHITISVDIEDAKGLSYNSGYDGDYEPKYDAHFEEIEVTISTDVYFEIGTSEANIPINIDLDRSNALYKELDQAANEFISEDDSSNKYMQKYLLDN